MAYQKTLAIRDTMREIAGLPCDHVSKTCSENRSQDELSQEEVLARSRDRSWRSAIVREPSRALCRDWRETKLGHRCGGKKLSRESFYPTSALLVRRDLQLFFNLFVLIQATLSW